MSTDALQRKLFALLSADVIGYSRLKGDDKKALLLTEAYYLTSEQADIGILPMEGNQSKELLLNENYFETDPEISSDGRYIAYVYNE
jgi:hypothetical protein